MTQYDGGERNQTRGHDAENSPGQRIGKRRVHVAARNRAQKKGEAKEHRSARDGRDNRLQASVDDDEPVDRAAGEAGQKNAEDAERGACRCSNDDPRGEAIGENKHRADRKIDAGGDDDESLGHRHQREQHALVGGGLHDIGAEARRMVARVDREHHDEEDDREKGRAVLGEDIAPVAHCAGAPAAASSAEMLSALAISARSVISAPASSRLIAPL